ncbi:hypothetical protein E2562_012451 [Oryza meyeriana var. granulata]|uniref:Uncharacterized protein n=1 Tax=Oryza meyeriana var. granulata TaxID=110450 RepID=A0A6G1C791_9ORYZ|nr:hypothetical protein E2562_012451 [Oryza meyeriana var. granulata]
MAPLRRSSLAAFHPSVLVSMTVTSPRARLLFGIDDALGAAALLGLGLGLVLLGGARGLVGPRAGVILLAEGGGAEDGVTKRSAMTVESSCGGGGLLLIGFGREGLLP